MESKAEVVQAVCKNLIGTVFSAQTVYDQISLVDKESLGIKKHEIGKIMRSRLDYVWRSC